MGIWPGFVTPNVEQAKQFYQQLFDAEIVYEAEDGWFVLLKIDGSELGFMQPELSFQAAAFRPAYGGQGSWITIEVSDAQQQLARAEAQGIEVLAPLRDEDWGDRHFVLRDPAGVAVDVVQRLV